MCLVWTSCHSRVLLYGLFIHKQFDVNKSNDFEQNDSDAQMFSKMEQEWSNKFILHLEEKNSVKPEIKTIAGNTKVYGVFPPLINIDISSYCYECPLLLL